VKGILAGLAVLPFLAAGALAEPMQLSNAQMDKVSAGTFLLEQSNTSVTIISIFQRPYLTDPTPNTITCPSCYLLIISPTLSIGAQFGPL